MEIVVDRMHMKGHIDKWCKEHYDPSRISALDKVMLSQNALISSVCASQ